MRIYAIISLILMLCLIGCPKLGYRKSSTGSPASSAAKMKTQTKGKSQPGQATSPSKGSAPYVADIIALARMIDPQPGAVVSIIELRQIAGMDKDAFDKEVLRLYQDQKINLFPHENPTSTNIDWLVPDGSGKYFIGLQVR